MGGYGGFDVTTGTTRARRFAAGPLASAPRRLPSTIVTWEENQLILAETNSGSLPRPRWDGSGTPFLMPSGLHEAGDRGATPVDHGGEVHALFQNIECGTTGSGRAFPAHPALGKR